MYEADLSPTLSPIRFDMGSTSAHHPGRWNSDRSGYFGVAVGEGEGVGDGLSGSSGDGEGDTVGDTVGEGVGGVCIGTAEFEPAPPAGGPATAPAIRNVARTDTYNTLANIFISLFI